MQVIGFIGCLCVVVLFLVFAKEPLMDIVVPNPLLKPFYKVVAGILRICRMGNNEDRTQFIKLYGQNNTDAAVREFQIRKMVQSFLLVCVALLALTFGEVKITETNLADSNTIQRPDIGKGDRDIHLVATMKNGVKENIVLNVAELEYSQDRFEALCEEHFPDIVYAIMSQNEDTQNIRYDLNLCDLVFPENYPFDITVRSRDPSAIAQDGSLQSSLNEEGCLVPLVVKVEYLDYEWERELEVCAYTPLNGSETSVRNLVYEDLELTEEATRLQDRFQLPQQLDGEPITWEEKGKTPLVTVGMLLLIVAMINYIMRNKEIQKRVRKRDDLLTKEYAVLVSKLGIYLGAGLSTREAFRRLQTLSDSTGVKQISPVNKEIAVTLNEMESGISEVKAYENFGRRCGQKEYVKFAALLVNHCKKGNRGMMAELQEESSRAWEEQKAHARQYGEKAGTKLLFPMMLLLINVMMIILIPAFQLFSL